MDITALQRPVQAADLPLEKLAGSHQLSEKEKIGELSQQFEAVLVRQILASAQKPVFKSKLNPDSASQAIYRDLITKQLADGISRSGAIGFADTLAHQLDHQLKPDGQGSEVEGRGLANGHPESKAVGSTAAPLPHSSPLSHSSHSSQL